MNDRNLIIRKYEVRFDAANPAFALALPKSVHILPGIFLDGDRIQIHCAFMKRDQAEMRLIQMRWVEIWRWQSEVEFEEDRIGVLYQRHGAVVNPIHGDSILHLFTEITG